MTARDTTCSRRHLKTTVTTGGDVGAGTICRGGAVMRVTYVQAASGSAFWSSVKGLTAQVTVLIPFIFLMVLIARIIVVWNVQCVFKFDKLEITQRCGPCELNHPSLSNSIFICISFPQFFQCSLNKGGCSKYMETPPFVDSDQTRAKSNNFLLILVLSMDTFLYLVVESLEKRFRWL